MNGLVQQMYRGRIAPSPTGLLHLGHARTFWTACQRARSAGGILVFRNEDLDPQRSRPEFAAAMVEDLHWLGIRWQEGPHADSQAANPLPNAPYAQSERTYIYLRAWHTLLAAGHLYPCRCSRKDLAASAHAPHESAKEHDAEPLYPGTCRRTLPRDEIDDWLRRGPDGANWRFRVPDGETIAFTDNNSVYGQRSFTAGREFGDFAVWRRDGVPAYQLACVVDDAAMRITEVVRGADLLLSTARQTLLQRALSFPTPQHYHCELVKDAEGKRLAKRHDALSLRALREQGWTPERVIDSFGDTAPSSRNG
jgi:glutamyl-tRNA synthetase